MTMVVSNTVAVESNDLTPPYDTDDSANDPDIVANAEYKIVLSYTDPNQFFADVPWSVKFLGNANSDNLLKRGQKAEITVWLLERDTAIPDASTTDGAVYYSGPDANGSVGLESGGTLLDVNDQFTIEIQPPIGAVLTVQRTAPARLDAVMDLK